MRHIWSYMFISKPYPGKVEFEVARVDNLLCCSHQCAGDWIFINSIKSFLGWYGMIFHLCAGEAQTSWDKQGGYAETHWSEGGGSAKIWTETQMSKHPYNHPKSQYHPPKYDDLRSFYNGNPLKPSAVWLIFWGALEFLRPGHTARWLMSWLLRKPGDHWGMIPTRYRLQIEIDIDRHDISSMRCAKFQKDLFFGRFPSMKGDLHGFKFSPFATLILGMHVTGAKQPPRVASAFLFLSHKESISWTMTSTSKSATWCQCILAANRLVECSDERAKTKKKKTKKKHLKTNPHRNQKNMWGFKCFFPLEKKPEAPKTWRNLLRPETAYGAQLQIFMVHKDLMTAETLKLTVGVAGMNMAGDADLLHGRHKALFSKSW